MSFTSDDYEMLGKAIGMNPKNNREPHPERDQAIGALLARDSAFIKLLVDWLASDESLSDDEEYSPLLKAIILSGKLPLRDCLMLSTNLLGSTTWPFDEATEVFRSPAVEHYFGSALKAMHIVTGFELFKAYLHDFGPETSEGKVGDVNIWAIPLAKYLNWGPLKDAITEIDVMEPEFADDKAFWNSLITTRLQLLDHKEF